MSVNTLFLRWENYYALGKYAIKGMRWCAPVSLRYDQ